MQEDTEGDDGENSEGTTAITTASVQDALGDDGESAGITTTTNVSITDSEFDAVLDAFDDEKGAAVPTDGSPNKPEPADVAVPETIFEDNNGKMDDEEVSAHLRCTQM